MAIRGEFRGKARRNLQKSDRVTMPDLVFHSVYFNQKISIYVKSNDIEGKLLNKSAFFLKDCTVLFIFFIVIITIVTIKKDLCKTLRRQTDQVKKNPTNTRHTN